jgi:hypothetical protein
VNEAGQMRRLQSGAGLGGKVERRRHGEEAATR